MTSTVISGVTFGLCALIMFTIGVSQLKSKTPVVMWIIYGFIIVAARIAGLFCNGSALILIPYMGGLLIPVIFMIRYHNKLIKMYYIK